MSAKVRDAVRRALKRLQRRHAHLAGHQGYEALGLLLLELGPAAEARARISGKKGDKEGTS